MLKHRLFLAIALVSALYCQAQSTQAPAIKLPTVIPASPAATDLAKYVNYPVNYSNGLPDINIPIFVVTDGDITIPISLSYHASGLKLHQGDGWLSRGWTLNAEPGLSRAIQGMPDEESYVLNSSHSPTVRESPFYREQLEAGTRDEQPDEFYFRLLNSSGKFFIKKEYNLPLETVTIPKQPVKINIVNETALDQFTILDNKGLSYAFGGYSYRESTNLGKVTGWKPTAVTSALTGRSVTFTYHPQNFRNINPPVSNSISVLDSDSGIPQGLVIYETNPLGQDPPPVFQLPQPTVLETIGGTTYYYKVTNTPPVGGQLIPIGQSSSGGDVSASETSHLDIHEIIFSNGKVVFNKQGDGNSRLLKSIEIYHNNILVKEVEFHQSNFFSTIYRLDSISLRDANRVIVERYRFKYSEYSLTGSTNYDVDHWGFFNDAHNSRFIPVINTYGRSNNPWTGQAFNFTVGGANREPNEYATQANILKAITYPTGGKAEFEYEGHRYRDGGGVVRSAGGLRVKSIKQVNSDGTSITRFFKYGVGEDGVGILRTPITTENYYSTRRELYCKTPYIGYSAESASYIWITANAPISLIRKSYSSHSYMDLFYDGGSAVQYSVVTEYTANDIWGNGALGKQMFYYNIFSGSLKSKINGETTIIDTKIEWLHGEDTLHQIYKSQAGTFVQMQQQQKKHSATFLPEPSFSVGKAYAHIKVIASENDFHLYRSEQVITLYRYPVSSGYKRVWKVLDAYTENGNTLNKETDYTYDGYLNLTREALKDSNGDSIVYEYQYPYSPGSMMSLYNTNNNVSPVILKKKLVNNVLTEQTQTNYRLSPLPGPMSEQALPVSVHYASGANPLEKRLSYVKYDDKGNLLSVAMENDVVVNYVYSYNGSYPVAKIENADYATVEAALGGAAAVLSFRNIASPSDAAVNSFLAPLRTDASLGKAMVNTYTYRPLVGLTSETDVKGKITTYEYDAFGRLKATRDLQGNIIKQFDYKYQVPAAQ